MKYCEKCGNELKEGFAFCDKCGAKVSTKETKKEKKEKEEIKEEVKEEVNEKVEQKKQAPVAPKKPKSGKGKIVFLTILNILLLAATITFLVLWLIKPTEEKCEKNYNDDNGNTEKPIDDPKKTDNEYVGKWEQHVEYKSGSKVTQRTYGLIQLTKDGEFKAVYYDEDDKSGTMEETKGTYTIKNNKITFKYKLDGENETLDAYFKNNKLCMDDDCEDYLTKNGNNTIVIYDDDDDDDDFTKTSIKTINYTEYENLQKNYKDAIVVVVRDGCSWCEKFESVVEEIDENYVTSVYYYESDGKISITGTPTTILIKNGYIVDTINGYKDYDDMVEALDEVGIY